MKQDEKKLETRWKKKRRQTNGTHHVRMRSELSHQVGFSDEGREFGLEADQVSWSAQRMWADLLGEEDPGMERMLGMQAVAAHWGELSAREQTILTMRFYGEMTQAQIGDEQLSEPQAITLNLKLVRNPYLGRNKRYPFAVADYAFGQPKQLPIQRRP